MLLPEHTPAWEATRSFTFQETASAVLPSKEKQKSMLRALEVHGTVTILQMAQGLGHIVIKQFGAPRTTGHHDGHSQLKEAIRCTPSHPIEAQLIFPESELFV